jgi:hypothetical protein
VIRDIPNGNMHIRHRHGSEPSAPMSFDFTLRPEIQIMQERFTRHSRIAIYAGHSNLAHQGRMIVLGQPFLSPATKL